MRSIGRRLSPQERFLLALFVLSLPLVNPVVHGDGVGYYAYVRSLLVDGDLRFENEYLAGNEAFVLRRTDEHGRLHPEVYTRTGYVYNNHAVGPSLLWAPFLILTHGAVRVAQALGAGVVPDGFSWPYLWTMALATAGYGFAALWIAFRLARRYVAERWALLATLGIWFGSSLPVYMYFNPAWAHAHSAFTVAVFLWYWQRTREQRTLQQWVLLGLLGGLMLNVYYPTGVLLVLPLWDALGGYWKSWQGGQDLRQMARLFVAHGVFLGVLLVALLPTFLTRQILFGHPLRTGYAEPHLWNWTQPVLWEVLFSANHGLLSWTPVLFPAVVGLWWLRRKDRALGNAGVVVFLAFYYVIAAYMYWHGMSSFGNRFFVSLVPLFVLGLAAALERMAEWLVEPRRAFTVQAGVLVLLVVWNAGLIFQWGTRMIPARGPVVWCEVARNQVTAVPARLVQTLHRYVVARGALMEQIEAHDLPPRQPEPTPERRPE
ncbi:MAG: hypothetical protein K6U02_05560 [Firmicutes bacterium]|nr:hypothetical protein [Bacillota bacterium]